VLVFSLCLNFHSAGAQEDRCSSFIQAALASIPAACTTLGSDEACYAHDPVEVEFQNGVSGVNFSQAGDVAAADAIRTLSVNGIDPASQQWGVVVARVAESTLVLLGQVEWNNDIQTRPAAFSVSANGSINIRSGPTTESDVVAGLRAGQTVTAVGRLEDSSWLNIILPDSTSDTGWVSAQLVTAEGEIESLDVIDPDAPRIGPMQAFHFHSGIGDAPCTDVPGGILIQSPDDSMVRATVA